MKPATHAIQRAHERYGIGLTPDDLGTMTAEIAAGQALCLERWSRKVGVYAVQHRTRLMVALYDHKARTILTFLPSAPFGVR